MVGTLSSASATSLSFEAVEMTLRRCRNARCCSVFSQPSTRSSQRHRKVTRRTYSHPPGYISSRAKARVRHPRAASRAFTRRSSSVFAIYACRSAMAMRRSRLPTTVNGRAPASSTLYRWARLTPSRGSLRISICHKCHTWRGDLKHSYSVTGCWRRLCLYEERGRRPSCRGTVLPAVLGADAHEAASGIGTWAPCVGRCRRPDSGDR